MAETTHKTGDVHVRHEHECCGAKTVEAEEGHATVKADHECCQEQAPVKAAQSSCGCGGSRSTAKIDRRD
ncbi:hypothetical protein [Rhodoligotrophos ferricapiens]|uniref:hypothetical protein n=1 Tax=Rhodoligotrophos ferricapiens TaxID=3069264 RepID=UPI00315CD583